jgi:hypothetical protein
MAKFKPVRAKSKRGPAPKAGLPCIIFILLAMVLVMLLLIFAMKSYSPN